MMHLKLNDWVTRLLYTAVGALFMHGAQAQQIDFGVAGTYSAFVLGSFSGKFRLEGRLAVGRDLNADSMLAIGEPAPTGPPVPGLVVGRDVLKLKVGAIYNGAGGKGYGIVSGKILSAPAGMDLRKTDLPFDFEAEAIRLNMLSRELASKPLTGTVAVVDDALVLRGTNADAEVFSVTGEQAALFKVILFENVKDDAWILVNILANKSGANVLRLMQYPLQPFSSRLVLHYPDAISLQITGSDVFGTLFGPGLCVTTGFSTDFSDKVIVNSLTGTGMIATPSGTPSQTVAEAPSRHGKSRDAENNNNQN